MCGIDPDDPRVSMHASHEGDVERLLEAKVIDVAAAPGEEPMIFPASDRRADHAAYP